jgi:hypothetical protein
MVALEPSLNGAGIRIAQSEAGLPVWEVNSNIQPAAVLNYYGSNGMSSVFPNSLGQDSSHADAVGALLFGPQGVAPGISIVDNYEADYFENVVVQNDESIPAPLVNQSFINETTNNQDLIFVDEIYDGYASLYHVLFVSAAGNGGTVSSPGTSYNGLGVGAWGGSSAVGPTPENGRCKPDITAPGSLTSFTTPLVSGAAAILLQSAKQGDGGPGTASLAADPRVLKALLLNGAVKPSDWTNSTTNPLDFRYGAGIVNVFNSWSQLAAGRVQASARASIASGSPHPPSTTASGGGQLTGWDLSTVAFRSASDGLNHYYFQMPSGTNSLWTLQATLVWNRDGATAPLENLSLFLYRIADGALMASSESSVDNVQHIFLQGLPAGAYDLQVLNSGTGGQTSSGTETYALAFSFTSSVISIAPSANGPVLSWPIYPDGLTLQASASLGPTSNWTNVTSQAMLTNSQNSLSVGNPGATMFYRLVAP